MYFIYILSELHSRYYYNNFHPHDILFIYIFITSVKYCVIIWINKYVNIELIKSIIYRVYLGSDKFFINRILGRKINKFKLIDINEGLVPDIIVKIASKDYVV